MAAITATAAQVAPVNEIEYVARTYLADVALTAGQVVYHKSDGDAAPARANAVGTAKAIGVVVRPSSAGAKQPVTVIQEGGVAGFDLSGLAYGDVVYVSSDTAGAIEDTIISGTGNVVTPIGVVDGLPDGTKFLRVSIDLTRVAEDLA